MWVPSVRTGVRRIWLLVSIWGTLRVIFMDTMAESCPRVTEGGRISSFRFCAVAKVPHNKRLNSMFVLSFMTDRVYLLLYLLNEINE